MKTAFVVCVLIGSLAHSLNARVVRVPEQAPTIQAGLDSLTDGDTVIVARHRYEETLIGPAFSFTLLGDYEPDSVNFPRPVVDGTFIYRPDTTAALSLPRLANAVIENLEFRCGSRDGIRSRADWVVVRNCVILAAYEGFRQKQDSIGASVLLERVEFSENLFHCVLVRTNNSLTARECSFSCVGGSFRALVQASYSNLDLCRFIGTEGRILLSCGWGPHRITNCEFGPCETEPFDGAVLLGSQTVYFANNTIRNCTYGHHAVGVSSVTPDSVEIRDNRFVNCRGEEIVQAAAGVLSIRYAEAPTGEGAKIVGNTFENCAGYVTCDDIFPTIVYPMRIDSNRFIHDSLNGLPAIGGSGTIWQPTAYTMRGNVFEECGYALDGTFETDARWNYWGDPSGPYQATLNPQGLGDTLTGDVQFIPWLADTTTSARETRPELATEVMLAAQPNPFNMTTTLSFTLANAAHVELTIFDLLGREVTTLLDRRMTSGAHSISFDAAAFSSGVYFARLVTARHSAATKLILLK